MSIPNEALQKVTLRWRPPARSGTTSNATLLPSLSRRSRPGPSRLNSRSTSSSPRLRRSSAKPGCCSLPRRKLASCPRRPTSTRGSARCRMSHHSPIRGLGLLSFSGLWRGQSQTWIDGWRARRPSSARRSPTWRRSYTIWRRHTRTAESTSNRSSRAAAGADGRGITSGGPPAGLVDRDGRV